jgi:hypothetical protein
MLTVMAAGVYVTLELQTYIYPLNQEVKVVAVNEQPTNYQFHAHVYDGVVYG